MTNDNTLHFQHWKCSVAPMMDWTDRHCRFFHRLMTRHTLLYTEMVTAAAIVHGANPERFLAYSTEEHPLALQLGGSDPQQLAQAITMAAPYNYDEINLNVGCPSDRVKSGSFGACLMLTPAIVADCVRAMKSATDAPITVKCRIGVDDQIPEQILPQFIEALVNAGVDGVIIHARKAILGGLSPHQNRTIPELNYTLAHEIKNQFPALPIALNGGLTELAAFQEHCIGKNVLNGIMIGRAAYQNPWLLAHADTEIFGATQNPLQSPDELLAPLCAYVETQLSQGENLHRIAKHLLGLFTGMPNARTFRRILAEESLVKNAGPEVLEKAWNVVAHPIAIHHTDKTTETTCHDTYS